MGIRHGTFISEKGIVYIGSEIVNIGHEIFITESEAIYIESKIIYIGDEMMQKHELTKEQEQMARFAKAMGHPIRIAILQMLANQTCCFHGDMSELLPIAKSTLSQHLNELKDAGLIQGEITPPMVKYCINKENWKLVKSLLGEFIDHIATTKGGV